MSAVAVVTVLSLAACALLFAAWPHGVIWPDTLGYLRQAMIFSLFERNDMDWRHMPLFSMLLRFSLLFSRPVSVVVWVHAAVFAAIIGIACTLARDALGSVRRGFLYALALLACEVLLMNTFLYLATLVADTLFALLMLAGSLVAILGWWRRRTAVLWCGFVLLGLCVITKPAGMIIVPLWTVFALLCGYGTYRVSRSRKTAGVQVLVCLLLLLLPLSVWCSRNLLLYGAFKSSAFLSRNIMARALPLVEEGDVLTGNAALDAQLIREQRAFEAAVGTEFNDYMSFGIVQGLESPMFALARTVPGERMGYATDYPFRFDPYGVRIALRIIAQHPVEYAGTSASYYLQLWRPWIAGNPQPGNVQNSRNWYYRREKDQFAPAWLLRALYPPDGTYDPDAAHAGADTLLRRSNPLRSVLLQPAAGVVSAVVAHCLLLWSAWLLWRRRNHSVTRERLRLLAAVTLLVIGNAVCSYLLAALVEEPLRRYQLAGSMGLNFVYLLWIAHGITGLWQRWQPPASAPAA